MKHANALAATNKPTSAKIDLSVSPLELANAMLFFQTDLDLLDELGARYFTEVSKEVCKE